MESIRQTQRGRTPINRSAISFIGGVIGSFGAFAAAVRNVEVERNAKKEEDNSDIIIIYNIPRKPEYKHRINCNIGKICMQTWNTL